MVTLGMLATPVVQVRHTSKTKGHIATVIWGRVMIELRWDEVFTGTIYERRGEEYYKTSLYFKERNFHKAIGLAIQKAIALNGG